MTMHALAWTLIHFLWEGALIALVLTLTLGMLRRASASVRYAVACAALLAMLCAFGITLGILWPWPPEAMPVPGLRPPLPAEARSTLATLPRPPQTDPLRWLVPLWMLGAGICCARSVAGWIAAQRLRRVGVCAAPEQWQIRMRELAERLRVSRPVALLESSLAEVPMATGCLRPAILIPAGLLTGFPPEQIECFLLHELTHIRRWDYLVNLLQSAAEDLLFYHPAVWWVSSIVRAEREHCCDDVVAEIGDARGLARALAALEQRRASVQPALAANGGRLLGRIQRLLGQPESSRSAAAPVLLAGLLAISVAVAFGATQKTDALGWKPEPPMALPPLAWTKERPQVLLAQTPAPGQAAGPAEPANVTPYQKWLNEEAVYVITDAERDAFLRLETDEERQQFIRQFWLRRDPTPGTPENEYQEEHYRRIAYVNRAFIAGSIPGWKTDRGMVYIKYGPPDELERHPKAGPYQRPLEEGGGITVAVYPFEKWLYRYITGIGSNVNIEFVDRSGTGDYRMTTDPAEKSTPAQPATPRRMRGPAPPAAAAPGVVAVTPRARGTVTAIYVVYGQSVHKGDALLEIDEAGGERRKTLSPIDGTISSAPAASIGATVQPGQTLLTIAGSGDTQFEAAAKAAMYGAGYEAGYRHYGLGHDNNDPEVKELDAAVRDLNTLIKQSGYVSTPESRSELERLQTIVDRLHAQRLEVQK
jgi:GWxTD domain-containing protein